MREHVYTGIGLCVQRRRVYVCGGLVHGRDVLGYTTDELMMGTTPKPSVLSTELYTTHEFIGRRSRGFIGTRSDFYYGQCLVWARRCECAGMYIRESAYVCSAGVRTSVGSRSRA